MFLVRLAIKIAFGLLLLVIIFVVVGNFYARSEAQKKIAARVKATTHAETVSAKISAMPFLYQVAVSKVRSLQVVAKEVPVGKLRIDQVTLNANQIKVDRGELFSRKVKIDSVGSATVTATVKTSDLLGGIVPTALQSVANAADLQLVVTSGHELQIDALGHEIGSVDLGSSPLLPSCAYRVHAVSDGFTLSCTVAPVPQELLNTISSERL
jgi:regulator of protease activity HflC (stomatin/prohibitin superfamily)